MLLSLALATAATLAQPVPRTLPQPQPLRTFGDWIMGCDNGLTCQALSLVPDSYSGEYESYLMLTLSRGGEGAAPLRLGWDNEYDGTAILSIDGQTIAPRATRDMALTPPMIDALRRGTLIALTLPDGRRWQASLTGISASLLAMDDRQGRVDTATAAVRRGTRVMRPSSPALPVIVRPAASSQVPRNVTPTRAAALIGPDYARCEESIAPVEPAAHRLDATHSLVLVDHPCGNGAYNFFTTALIVDERGTVAPARFDVDPGMWGEEGDAPGNIIVGAYYDPVGRTLYSYAKGRGIGDCGTASQFVWTGSYFALSNQEMMNECRLRTSFIPVWRATVR